MDEHLTAAETTGAGSVAACVFGAYRTLLDTAPALAAEIGEGEARCLACSTYPKETPA